MKKLKVFISVFFVIFLIFGFTLPIMWYFSGLFISVLAIAVVTTWHSLDY